MNFIESYRSRLVQIGPDYFKKYMRPARFKVDPTQANVELWCGEERKKLKTLTNGHTTFLLRYKEAEGVVVSMESEGEELEIVQYQGAKNKRSYVVAVGFQCTKLMADQIDGLTTDKQSPFKRIIMPDLDEIEGLVETRSENCMKKYLDLSRELGLRFSKTEKKYIKDLK